MQILDTLSGHDFEDVMEDVFRKVGYQNVRQSKKTGDEGRDILMEETVNGQRRAVVVECKHQQKIGRPVVQKLHSAIVTYDFDGPKRGIIATTGRFTKQAEEYANQLRQGEHRVELLDGNDLRDLADDVGLDLYNGRIEILCDETLRPVDPSGGVDAPVREAFQGVKNLDTNSLPKPQSTISFEPYLTIEAETNAIFETTVGEIHRVQESDSFLADASREELAMADDSIKQLVTDGGKHTVRLDDRSITKSFDDTTSEHFGNTETDYKDWMVERLRSKYTETVEYTGDNNVTYEKTCEPKQSDISVSAITPIYVPRVRSTTTLKNYDYSMEYHAAGPSRNVIENGIQTCVHCSRSKLTSHTFCENCGSINCRRHTKTERVTGEPICSGCAVTDRFALRKRYFVDKENLDSFREEYDAMPMHQKALENKPLIASTVVMICLIVILFI